jgi:hypothetical protein
MLPASTHGQRPVPPVRRGDAAAGAGGVLAATAGGWAAGPAPAVEPLPVDAGGSVTVDGLLPAPLGVPLPVEAPDPLGPVVVGGAAVGAGVGLP